MEKQKKMVDFEKMASQYAKMIVDHTPVAYVIMDKDHNIVYTNQYVFNLTGYSPEEVMGAKCYDVVNKGIPCPNCAVRLAKQSGKNERILKEELDKAGNEIYNEMIAVPLFEEDGTYEYLMEIVISKTQEVSLRKKIERDFFRLVETLGYVLGTRDEYTGNHSHNVERIIKLVADKLNLSPDEKSTLNIAASLHDIGKVGISDKILNKEGKLTDEEYTIIQSHPVLGEGILANIESFNTIKEIVKYHHERYDGKGYPDGLAGDDIPYFARLIAIADTYDAMTTTRPYRKALGREYARDELIKYKGTQFDPSLVPVFVALIDENLI